MGFSAASRTVVKQRTTFKRLFLTVLPVLGPVLLVLISVSWKFRACGERVATATPLSAQWHPSASATTTPIATYESLYEASREFFSYESPLPHWPPHEQSVKRFEVSINLFDWRVPQQLELWSQFKDAAYVTENLKDLLQDSLGMFPDLDRVFLYCFIRHHRPDKIYEIGSGESTEVVRQAIAHGNLRSKHVAIEPYRFNEVPKNVHVIRSEVQELEFTFFDGLSAGDILFIDSSHVTMPYGDTLTELLTILPRLSKGVIVHIHDVFLPYDYPKDWFKKNYVYTEQWLVALMLYGAEHEWEVIWGSRLMMTTKHNEILSMPAYPLREGQNKPNGGSLWIRKVGPPRRQLFDNGIVGPIPSE